MANSLAIPRVARNSVSVIAGFVLFLPSLLYAQEPSPVDLPEATDLHRQGRYDDVARHSAMALKDEPSNEDWWELKIQSELARGKYPEALATLTLALEKRPNSIRLRWIGHEVCLYNGLEERAAALHDEFGELVSKSSWRYRSAENYVTLGRFFLYHGADAKQVLESFYDKAKQLLTTSAEGFLASGELALQKHDYGLAAEAFEKAAEIDARDPRAHFGLTQAYAASDRAKSKQSLQAVLKLNENHIDGLLLMADEHIDSERYSDAETLLARVLVVNDKHPRAWAYRAVLAHLANDSAREHECREKALKHWAENPDVDHLIGRKLSQKYRFTEGATYQRRALAMEADYLPAKMQLTQDLLRLGQEQEGWRLADEVYDADGYNVVAHNLVTLRDNIQGYTVLKSDGFAVRMESREAKIYGDDVLALLRRASEELCSKYEAELPEPIYVEIFPQQQDFAIRTFGLPGGAGFLGVCFGQVITMNSPASQAASPTNWQSVLWHEFCHVVTLTKTNNKMPRWLSEGVSVYEERQANPAWGEQLSPRYREMILGDDLVPVSRLSGAFLSPASPVHLQFAYYESSLVVEYLVDKYGLDTLKRVLVDLSVGMPINDSLGRYVGSIELLDREFTEYAREHADQLAPELDWEPCDLPPRADLQAVRAWNGEHPKNYAGMRREAAVLIKQQKWDDAKELLGKLIQMYPNDRGPSGAHAMLAGIHRELKDAEQERATLEHLAALDDNSLAVYVRLMQLHTEEENWEAVLENVRRALAVNPLRAGPHEMLARAAEQTGKADDAIRALRTLVIMEPVDPAGVHFRLAKLLHQADDLPAAKRSVLKSLEEAPRFRAAHRELLAISRKLKKQNSPKNNDADNDNSKPDDSAQR